MAGRCTTPESCSREDCGNPYCREGYRPSVAVVGQLDRALSEFKLLAKSQLDDADRQTVKHHAEDCVLLGRYVLKLLGAEEPK